MNLSEIPILVIDVESIGLQGEGYAVAGAVYINKEEKEFFCYSCNPLSVREESSAARKWCNENIPSIQFTHIGPKDLRNGFCNMWEALKIRYPGIIMAAECGWPVEANFLSQCVTLSSSDGRKLFDSFSGPYPLHDISSFMLLAGMDPMKTYDRLPNELPKHDPLADVRQSARLMYEAFTRAENNMFAKMFSERPENQIR